MDNLEFAMRNIDYFERFTEDAMITLDSGLIYIQAPTLAGFISIGFLDREDPLNFIYEIVYYKEMLVPKYYSFYENAAKNNSLEEFLDTVKKDHPHFFEWIIWNLL